MIAFTHHESEGIHEFLILETTIDSSNCRYLYEAVVAQAKEPFRMVIDLGSVAYIDSSGIGTILRILKEMREKGGDLRISSVQESVGKILALVGLPGLMRIYNTSAEAQNSFKD